MRFDILTPMSPVTDRSTRLPPEVLRVLHLEDAEVDHQLACAQLRRAGFEVQALRVDTEDDFRRTLAGPRAVSYTHLTLPTTPYV